MLAFWNNGSPRKVKGTTVKLPNGDTVMNAKADKSIDLYNYVVIRTAPTNYQHVGPFSSALVGDTIMVTNTVVANSNERIVATVLESIKRKRDEVSTAGIQWGDYVVQTKESSQAKLTGALVGLSVSKDATQLWRMLDNTVVVMPVAEFTAMAMAVSAHINACYTYQGELEAIVMASDSPENVDVTVGWPDHYEEEVQ